MISPDIEYVLGSQKIINAVRFFFQLSEISCNHGSIKMV